MRRSSLWLAGAAMLIGGAAPPSAQDLVFTGACDGSAAVLRDGKIVVANDEDNRLRTYEPTGGDPVATINLASHLAAPDSEADIEGAAAAGGRIYWIGSHGRNRNNKFRPQRHRFFATTATGAMSASGDVRRDLMAHAAVQTALQPFKLAEGLEIGPEAAGGVNVEGLATDGASGLLIAFRNPHAPLPGGRTGAVILPLLNPAPLLAPASAADLRAAPQFGTPFVIDLGGRGVRDILRTKAGGYVISAGSIGDGGEFALYRWAGPGTQPQQLPIGLGELEPKALVEAEDRLLLLSDDGTDECKARPEAKRSFRGRYVPLTP